MFKILIGISLPLMDADMMIPTKHLYALALTHEGTHRVARPPDNPRASVATIYQDGSIFLKK